jgi:hypothetical protein
MSSISVGMLQKCTENSLPEIIWCAVLTIYRQELQTLVSDVALDVKMCRESEILSNTNFNVQ